MAPNLWFEDGRRALFCRFGRRFLAIGTARRPFDFLSQKREGDGL
jgi:hypothetical protein